MTRKRKREDRQNRQRKSIQFLLNKKNKRTQRYNNKGCQQTRHVTKAKYLTLPNKNIENMILSTNTT